MAEMKRAFVCGHPIGHSRSPKIHSYWLEHFGLKGSYTTVDVAPTHLAAFIAGLADNGFVGGNVTIPHKEAVLPGLHSIDDAAKAIGAVNTLWFEAGKLCGGNTDAYGFAANLDTKAPGWDTSHTKAIVLGAGGAARAVLYALCQRGFQKIVVVNRSLPRAQELAKAFGVEACEWSALKDISSDCDLLVNTTSLGMKGQPDLDIDLGSLPEKCVVNDIVYVPLKTRLFTQAEARGLAVVDGLGMLLHQAVPGFERWFGQRPQVTDELYDLIAHDIGKGQ